MNTTLPIGRRPKDRSRHEHRWRSGKYTGLEFCTVARCPKFRCQRCGHASKMLFRDSNICGFCAYEIDRGEQEHGAAVRRVLRAASKIVRQHAARLSR